MKSKINKLIHEIELKKEELKNEYYSMRKKYDFSFIKGKIVFTKEANEKNKRNKKSVFDSIFTAGTREILSFPFIWFMFFPVLILDICLFIYQNTAMRLYKIPLAKRSDYIIYDRKQLSYLNWIQKINCLYCSYVNGFFSYCVEVAGRTERYWCPIKHAKKMKGGHSRQKDFADYGDSTGFKQTFCKDENTYKEK